MRVYYELEKKYRIYVRKIVQSNCPHTSIQIDNGSSIHDPLTKKCTDCNKILAQDKNTRNEKI